MNIPQPSSSSACSNNIKNSSMSCMADDLIVHFRPHWLYKGEFGFDWLRVNDIVADQKKPPYVLRHQVLAEPPYKDCLAGSLKSGHCWQNDPYKAAPLPYEKAYIDLKLAYRSFRVKHKGYADRYNNGHYFIPYLNLYDKKTSQEITQAYKQKYGIDIPVAPPYQATLRLFANAAGSPPLMVVVEFDPAYFNLTGGVLRNSPEDAQKKQLILPQGIWFNPDKPVARNKELPTPIIISCEKELEVEQDINVYAYYQGTSARKLAGRLCVCANDKKVRKTLPMVAVNVKTHTKKEETGELSIAEINSLYYFLYQALIYPELVTTHNQQRIILDLTNDPNFLLAKVDPKTKKTLPQGGFIDAKGNLIDTKEQLAPSAKGKGRSTHDYLKEVFDKSHGEFTAHFPIFAFGIPSTLEGSLGLVKKIGVKNLILTEDTDDVGSRATSKPFTCAHEVYHGLGVDHAHLNQDKQNLKKYGTQFVYYGAEALEIDANYPSSLISEQKSTDNLMSYKQTSNSTWRWQWQLARSNI